jgi:K+-transporting ATPase KdpF subunit
LRKIRPESASSYVGSFLRRNCDRFSLRLLAIREGMRSPLESEPYMDYIVGGATAVFLFGYLIYALLKPEKF